MAERTGRLIFPDFFGTKAGLTDSSSIVNTTSPLEPGETLFEKDTGQFKTNLSSSTLPYSQSGYTGNAIRFSNLTELRGYDYPFDYQLVHTISPKTFFYYDPVDTSSPDDGTTVIVSNNGKRFKAFSPLVSLLDNYYVSGSLIVSESVTTTETIEKNNVKYWGAVGDGVTDDSSSISDSINNNINSFIYFPSGSYKIDSNLTFENIDLVFDPGSSLLPNNGVTITINNTCKIINPSNFEIFDDSLGGSFVLNSNQTLYVNWFKADINEITGEKDIATSINKLTNSLGFPTVNNIDQKTRKIKLVGTHNLYTSANLTGYRAQGIDIDFSEASIFAYGALGSTVFEINKYPIFDYSYSHISNLDLGYLKASGIEFAIEGIEAGNGDTTFISASNHILSPGDYVNIFGWSGSASYGGDSQDKQYWVNGHYLVYDTSSLGFTISASYQGDLDTSGDYTLSGSVLPKMALLLARAAPIVDSNIKQFNWDNNNDSYLSGSVSTNHLNVQSKFSSGSVAYYFSGLYTSSIDNNHWSPTLTTSDQSRTKFTLGQSLLASDGNVYRAIRNFPSFNPTITTPSNYLTRIVTTGSLGENPDGSSFDWFLESGSVTKGGVTLDTSLYNSGYERPSQTWVKGQTSTPPYLSAGGSNIIGELTGKFGLTTVYNLASEENRLKTPLFLQNLENSSRYTFFASWGQKVGDLVTSKFNYLNCPPRIISDSGNCINGNQTSEGLYLDSTRIVGNSQTLVHADSFDKIYFRGGFWAGGDNNNLKIESEFKDCTVITVEGQYPHPNGSLECNHAVFVDVSSNSVKDFTFKNPRFSSARKYEFFASGSTINDTWDIELQGNLKDTDLSNVISLINCKISKLRGENSTKIYLPNNTKTGGTTIFSGQIFVQELGDIVSDNLTRKRYSVFASNDSLLGLVANAQIIHESNLDFISSGSINFHNLPTSDPGITGRLFQTSSEAIGGSAGYNLVLISP